MRIWDTFMFRNEFDVLRLRMEELWDVVDVFVLVESDKTLRGAPERLEFSEAKDQFSDYLDKIRVVQVTDMPTHGNAWVKEIHQRNAIMRGLEGASCDDIVLISDADEIPQRAVVAALPQILEESTVLAFEQDIYWYSLNWRVHTPWWGTRAVRRSMLDLMTPQGVRRGGTAAVKDGGWHFSYLAPQEEVVQRLLSKVAAFSHDEFDEGGFLDEDYIRACVENGFRWSDSGELSTRMTHEPIGPAHPLAVQADPARWSHLISPPPTEPRIMPRARTLTRPHAWTAIY